MNSPCQEASKGLIHEKRLHLSFDVETWLENLCVYVGSLHLILDNSVHSILDISVHVMHGALEGPEACHPLLRPTGWRAARFGATVFTERKVHVRYQTPGHRKGPHRALGESMWDRSFTLLWSLPHIHAHPMPPGYTEDEA
jgi:hypothetical protein